MPCLLNGSFGQIAAVEKVQDIQAILSKKQSPDLATTYIKLVDNPLPAKVLKSLGKYVRSHSLFLLVIYYYLFCFSFSARTIILEISANIPFHPDISICKAKRLDPTLNPAPEVG